jgi:hypothetical protein
MTNKYKGRSISSFTEEEIIMMPDDERRALLEWMVQVELNYMVAEGMVDSFIDPDTGEVLYKLPENTELES